MKYFLIAFGVLAVVIQLSTGMKKCLKPDSVRVSEKFLKQGKFFVPFHSDCDNCEEGDKKWSSFSGRTMPKKLCYTMGGVRKDGSTFDAIFKCKYQVSGEGACELLVDKPPTFAGSMILTKTDNSTYMAGTTCIFGKENFWWVASTTETLPDSLKTEIMDHFKKEGFTAKLAAQGETEIIFKHFTINAKDDC